MTRLLSRVTISRVVWKTQFMAIMLNPQIVAQCCPFDLSCSTLWNMAIPSHFTKILSPFASLYDFSHFRRVSHKHGQPRRNAVERRSTRITRLSN